MESPTLTDEERKVLNQMLKVHQILSTLIFAHEISITDIETLQAFAKLATDEAFINLCIENNRLYDLFSDAARLVEEYLRKNPDVANVMSKMTENAVDETAPGSTKETQD